MTTQIENQINTLEVPRLDTFNPNNIPFQYQVLKYLRTEHRYSKGAAQVLLSGSVGSAKTLLACHIITTHALLYPGSQILVLRRALRDLKSTIFRVLLGHFPRFTHFLNKSETKITLPNGSIIYGVSYDDGRYDKFRSYELSMVVLEEATESKDRQLYDELMMRIGRINSVPENIMLIVTNPDSPSHWIYKYFIEDGEKNNTKVYYSKTEDNKFLPAWYIENLKNNLDPKLARRMLYGEWIEISQDVIYYSYNPEIHYKRTIKYDIDPRFPIHISFDFNIGVGKPMSCCLSQFINGKFHFFDEVVIHGSRTLDVMEEIYAREYLNGKYKIEIYGDSTGTSRSTNSNLSDYELIKRYLANLNPIVPFEIKVPRSNPPVRQRHNLVNAYLLNTNKESRIIVYSKCKILNEGLRLTALKKGADYIEDDSKEFQHITTAIGYNIVYNHNQTGISKISTQSR